MKYKGLYSIILCIVVGGMMSKFILDQYDKSTNELQVSNIKDTVYFYQQGVYSSKESMEENIKNVEYYIYNIENNKYYVYIGMTAEEKNIDKLQSYFKNIGFETYIKEFEITNQPFLEVLQQYDLMLEKTDDTNTIAAICSQILAKYEELVINDED